MEQQRSKRLVVFAGLIVLLLGVSWWGIRKFAPTSSAIFVSDSPDGRYRVAVFNESWVGGGEYEAGLFQGSWPHRELSGDRVRWNHDSVSSSDFKPTWHSDGVDVNFGTGYGGDRATVYGTDVGGRQQWRQ